VGRRKQTSILDGLMEITSHLPWQAGVVLAAVAYGILHHYATKAPLPTNPDELRAMGKTIGDLAGSAITRTAAGILQYVVSFALLVGAGASFFRRRRQRELHDQVADDPDINALEKMSWLEFEGLVAETFRRKGFRVAERGGAGPDGGVDLEAYQGKDKYIIQCKQWKARQVGVAIVRELYGVMTAEHAVGGFVVTSGDFTAEAKKFAEGRSIELVDARQLRTMIGAPVQTTQLTPPTQAPEQPVCPKCGSPMVLRTAKSGSNVGRQFWGCSRFPACRSIIGI
jgi:restriction system protein